MGTFIEPLEPRQHFDTVEYAPEGIGGLAIGIDRRPIVAGEISVDGDNQTFGNSNIAVARLTAGGALDPSWQAAHSPAPAGAVLTALSPNSGANAVAVQADGKFVAAGYDWNDAAQTSSFALLRYNVDGTLDTTFGGTGYVRNDFGGNYASAQAVAIQPDGKIVVAGWVGLDGPALYRIAAARFNPDGTLDTTFGSGGLVTLKLTSRGIPQCRARSMAIAPDGKILLAGDSFYDETYIGGVDYWSDALVVRLNANGSLDTTFGSKGLSSYAIEKHRRRTSDTQAASMTTADDIAVDADGSADVAINANDRMYVLRLTPGGQPDASFAAGGWYIAAYASYARISSLALDEDGKLLLSGSIASNDVILRLTHAGTMDRTFGHNGTVDTDDTRNLTIAPDTSLYTGAYNSATRRNATDAPVALAITKSRRTGGTSGYLFTVDYHGPAAIDATTLNSSDLRVYAPSGASYPVKLLTLTAGQDGGQLATYRLAAPGGSWDATDNGQWRIQTRRRQVADTNAHFAAARVIGTFLARVPASATAQSLATVMPAALLPIPSPHRPWEDLL